MIYLALGSNMGDRQAMMDAAIAKLAAEGVKTVIRSSAIETPALLPPGAPPDWNMPYLNMVIDVETTHRPEALLGILKTIEQQLGRTHRGHWGPREIDIDLIAYHREVIETDELTLPHAQMPYRRFVLVPLMEIAPDWRHPVLDKTAEAMLAGLMR